MYSFTDPRSDPASDTKRAPARTTPNPQEITELHQLCREGRLYDVERWIRAGRPVQVAEGTPAKRRRATSALEIALEAGNHALVFLLLCNGYDPNQEPFSPLDLTLRTRRFDLVELLLEWGADPHRVDLDDLFGTYRSDLFGRFRELGVDLTADHAMALVLSEHTSNRPLFGFAKRHRESDPKIQTELNIALGYHVREENEKGVQLCLWAGADAHAPASDLRFWRRPDRDNGEDHEDEDFGVSAVYVACVRGNAEILKRLRSDPARDDFEDLYQAASSRAVIDILAKHTLPQNPGAVTQRHLWWATFDRGQWRSIDTLRRLFEIGVRWTEGSADEIANFRRCLLKASDSAFVDLMKLMATDDYCTPELLQALARTSAMHARMKKVGFVPLPPDDPKHYSQFRPTRSREVLKKFGVEISERRKARAVRRS